MTGVLVLAEVDSTGISATTRELVSAATVSNHDPVDLLIVGDLPADMSTVAIEGITRILQVPLNGAPSTPEAVSRAIQAAITATESGYLITSFTWDILPIAPVIAVSNDWALVADITAVTALDDTSLVLTRSGYGGKVQTDLHLPTDSGAVLLVRPGAMAPAQAGATPPVEVLPVPVHEDRITHIRHLEKTSTGIDLSGEPIIFAVGRGVGQENLSKFEAVAEQVGVGLGASRPVVDQGWLPHDHQIGQSGCEVQPSLYVAFGISGALQHMVGVRGAKKIVAINTDHNAPIFSHADFGSTADALTVLEAIEAKWANQ